MFPIYFDEDSLNGAVIAATRRMGVETSTVGEEARWGLSDEEQLTFAAQRGMAIYTTNVRDFPRIHVEWMTSGRSHAGIVILTERLAPIGLQVRAIGNLQRSLSAEDIKDGLVFLLNYAD